MERGLRVRARWSGRVSTFAVAVVWLFLAPAASHAAPDAGPAAAASPALAGAAEQAEQMRAGMTDDAVAFIKAASPLEQVTLVNTLGGFDTHSATHVSWFFRTASRAVSGDASMPIVTFYNPLADAALVTTWRRIDAHWWLTSVFRLDGQTLRGTRSGSWWTERRPIAESLQRQANESLTAAAKLTAGRLNTLPEAPLRTFAARLFLAERGLVSLTSNQAALSAYQAARSTLAGATPDQLAPGKSGASAAQLSAIGEDVRGSLVAVAAFQRSDGTTVTLASPLRPSLLLFVDFSGGSAPTPTNVTAVDLAAARSGGPA
jgi:hypothetical protein